MPLHSFIRMYWLSYSRTSSIHTCGWALSESSHVLHPPRWCRARPRTATSCCRPRCWRPVHPCTATSPRSVLAQPNSQCIGSWFSAAECSAKYRVEGRDIGPDGEASGLDAVIPAVYIAGQDLGSNEQNVCGVRAARRRREHRVEVGDVLAGGAVSPLRRGCHPDRPQVGGI
jgi:hypothetical protein